MSPAGVVSLRIAESILVLRGHRVILDTDLAGLKFSSVPPLAFTEQGVAMLSGVLKSPRAIAANIEIMRAFVRLRHGLLHCARQA